MDQRGTGLSTAISQSSLQLRGDEKVQADYMKSFRACIMSNISCTSIETIAGLFLGYRFSFYILAL